MGGDPVSSFTRFAVANKWGTVWAEFPTRSLAESFCQRNTSWWTPLHVIDRGVTS